MAGYLPPAELQPASTPPPQPYPASTTMPGPLGTTGPLLPPPTHAVNRPPRSRITRTPVIVAAAIVAAVGAVGFLARSATSGEDSRHPTNGAIRQTPVTGPTTASPTTFGGGFAKEYTDAAFSLPASGIPGVSFQSHGPAVTTDISESGVADIQYLPEADPGILKFYDDVQAAAIDGTPDGSA